MTDTFTVFKTHWLPSVTGPSQPAVLGNARVTTALPEGQLSTVWPSSRTAFLRLLLPGEPRCPQKTEHQQMLQRIDGPDAPGLRQAEHPLKYSSTKDLL